MKKTTIILLALMAMVSTRAWADPIIRPDTLGFVF